MNGMIDVAGPELPLPSLGRSVMRRQVTDFSVDGAWTAQ